LVGVGILNNKERNPLGASGCKAKAYGSAEILHIQTEPLEAQRLREFLDHVRKPIKRVGILLRRRSVAIPETRVIRRDEVKLIGQLIDQFTEHERRCGKAV